MKTLAQISQEITRNHDWNQAEHDLQVGLQAHPESAKGWYYYAQVELHQGKVVNAKNAIGKADAIDPTHSYAGSLEKYNAFVGKLHSTTSTSVVTHVAPKTTMFTSQPVQHHQNVSLAPYFVGGIVIILVVYLLSKMFNKSKTVYSSNHLESSNDIASTRPPIDYPTRPTDQTTPPYSGSMRPYHTLNVTQPPMVMSQPNSGSGVGGMVGGVVAGVLLDEAVSGLMHRGRNDSNSNTNSNFDSGSSSSQSSPDDSFDSGSSTSSDDSFDSGSSSSSDDSSDFDGGSSDDSSSSFDSSDSGGSDDSSSW